MYVDDNINGDDSYETTFELYKKSVACIKDAGFELRKFHTNDPNLQTTINKIEKFQPLEDSLKVLGIEIKMIVLLLIQTKFIMQVSNYSR